MYRDVEHAGGRVAAGRRAKSATQWQSRRWNDLIRVGPPPTRSFEAILGDLVGLDGHFWIG